MARVFHERTVYESIYPQRKIGILAGTAGFENGIVASVVQNGAVVMVQFQCVFPESHLQDNIL